MRPKDTTFHKGQVVQDAYGAGLFLDVVEEDDPTQTIGPCVMVRPVGETSPPVFVAVVNLKGR